MPKVSPILSDAGAMAEAKCVDAGPSITEGGYSPMTRDPYQEQNQGASCAASKVKALPPR
jgi:hypothetical protein